jgi:hypothetical protein
MKQSALRLLKVMSVTNFLYGDLILYIPWKYLSLILLWSSFEYIKCGFVEEMCVDFVCIMQELKGCWELGEADVYCLWKFEVTDGLFQYSACLN